MTTTYEKRTCPLCRGTGINASFRMPDTASICERCRGAGVVSVSIVDDWEPRPYPDTYQAEKNELERAEGWFPTFSRIFSRFWSGGGWVW